MNKNLSKIFSLIVMSLILSACASHGLSNKQKRFLQNEGFNLTQEGWSLGLPDDLLFGSDQYQVAPKTKEKIAHLSKQLLKYDLSKLKIIGHTDNVGANDYNFKLSEKRAEAIKDLFIEQGYKRENIVTIGRGSTQPIVPNTNDANKATNRRVNITIIP
ncbi:hypothetical protein B9T31_14280 [Acinetobacter sp. ANC 4558]|uniref:OmpA family protein n=1 Tax=Acinetobacter sp. ANC 4558 TaxID=1977876 RepID=UPI000A34744A|nr:OmpA family protein [Acinetobacter sp. ANC 4558]OTG83248.1 hypothetical protein B9T31_14280 [Acinetobacter sp. ANC 4558]